MSTELSRRSALKGVLFGAAALSTVRVLPALAQARGGTLKVGLTYDIDTLNVYSTGFLGDVQAAVVEGLLAPDGHAQYVPVLATEVPTVANGGIMLRRRRRDEDHLQTAPGREVARRSSVHLRRREVHMGGREGPKVHRRIQGRLLQDSNASTRPTILRSSCTTTSSCRPSPRPCSPSASCRNTPLEGTDLNARATMRSRSAPDPSW